jgi:histidinol dehydrogenase
VRELDLAALLPRVGEIVADVRARGDAALLEWAKRVDGGRPDALRVPAERLREARLDDETLAAVRALAGAVAAFVRPQRPPDVVVEAVPGVLAERRWVPLSSVGICVPGGRAPLLSSLVMTAVPARVAGVERIAVVTPRPAEATLAAAAALGLDEVYAVGGAHAVGALAYGTKTIRPVDKIVGPGGPWVTAAKLLVSARVAIDLPAGPSEVLVIADGTASPAAVAASLLAQAEHGPDSDAGLLALDADLARRVRERLDGAANVRIESADSLDTALRRAEAYAPEHLELHVAGAEEVAPLVRNAGSVFVGTSSVVGDYAAGATHVLPTGGLARGAGGLGLEAFLKPVQTVRATDLAAARAIGVPLARAEGLPRHAEALA